MSSYPVVQSVRKALWLLAELNSTGMATIGELHERTRIPKPTIVRLLETLICEGYVYKDHRMGAYQVAGKAAALSMGFHGGPLAIEAARAWAIDFTKRLKWPVAVCTLSGDGVIVHYSTIPDSPVSPFHSTIGTKFSLGRRALGLAYLAFCSEEERRALRQVMRRSANPENIFDDPSELDTIIAVAQRNGYAQRDRAVAPRSSATIAMAIRYEHRVLATFGVTFFKSAVRGPTFIALVDELAQAVKKMEADVLKLTVSQHGGVIA